MAYSNNILAIKQIQEALNHRPQKKLGLQNYTIQSSWEPRTMGIVTIDFPEEDQVGGEADVGVDCCSTRQRDSLERELYCSDF